MADRAGSSTGFPATTRQKLKQALRGFDVPARVVAFLEDCATPFTDPTIESCLQELRRIPLRTRRRLKRIERLSGELRRVLRNEVDLHLLTAFDLITLVNQHWRRLSGKGAKRALPDPVITGLDDPAMACLQTIFDGLGVLETAARESSPPRRQGNRPNLSMSRHILCKNVGYALGIMPASRPRQVLERMGDVDGYAWRRQALEKVLPIVLRAVNAMPHRRDYPPLLRAALGKLREQCDRSTEEQEADTDSSRRPRAARRVNGSPPEVPLPCSHPVHRVERNSRGAQ